MPEHVIVTFAVVKRFVHFLKVTVKLSAENFLFCVLLSVLSIKLVIWHEADVNIIAVV